MKIIALFFRVILMFICMAYSLVRVPESIGADDSPRADMAPVFSNTDSDNDGLPDWWEERYFGSANPGPNDDPDNDKISNLNEFRFGTHPLEADSDEDGISDYDEIYRYFTDPLMEDTDRGGNSDGYEIANGGSPLNPDDDDAPGKVFSIALQKGLNLFSIPVTPANTGITSVLASIAGKYTFVWGEYTDTEGKWKLYDSVKPNFSNLLSIKSGVGYWIMMTESATLTVAGSIPSKSVQLLKVSHRGWNLVGYNSGTPQKIETAFSSVSGKIIAVWTFIDGQWKLFDPVTPIFSNLFTITPGYGYWIQAKENCTWTLP